MTIVQERLLVQNIETTSPDPYLTARDLYAWSQSVGHAVLLDDKLRAFGPRTHYSVEWTISRSLDAFSKITIHIRMSGYLELGEVNTTIEAEFRAHLPNRDGFFKEGFIEYWLSNIMPIVRRDGEHIVKDTVKQIRNQLEPILRVA